MKIENNVWQLEKWYEKVAYVVGVIYSAVFVGSFILGFTLALFA